MEQQQPAFQFGAFELNPHTRELRKHGIKWKLQDQPLQILLVLLERPGEVVRREEIQRRLWPENTYVDFDNAINSAVRKLRDALNDSAENPRFIETVARRGYRFIAPVNDRAHVVTVEKVEPEGKQRRLAIGKRSWIAFGAVLILAIAAGVLYKVSIERNRSDRDVLPAPVPLTTYPGFQWSPSFSPDGTRVAFTWDEPGKRPASIYVKLMGPSDPVRLTSGEETDFAPAWSPDGRWIAFLRAKGPFSAAILLIPSLGGTARELAQLQVRTSRLFYYGWWTATPPFLAWSADGKWLLALEESDSEERTRETPLRIVRISVESGKKNAFALSVDGDQSGHGGPPSFLKGEEGLAVSPDGRSLAFIHTVESPNARMYLVPLNDEMMPAGPARRLHFDEGRCQGIAWDPDGRGIIVSSDRRGSFELWRVPISPSAPPSLLGVNDGDPADLAVSKTAHHLVYTHRSYDFNIWRVDLTKGRPSGPVAFIASTRNEFYPSYSPDGKRIAFESNRSGNEEIWVSEADASHPIQITSFGNKYAGSPKWSPDGQHVAFDSNADGRWNVYVIDSQGGKPVRLTSGSGSKIRPSWSHDGKWIYYCASGESGPQIWKLPSGGGAEVQITKHGGCNQLESPDGRYVYYLNKGNIALWRVSINGGDEVELAQLGPESQFTLGKNGAYLNSRDSNTLKFLDYRTGSIKLLGTLPGTFGPGLAVSPDGRWLLFGRGESEGSQLMLVDKFR